MGIGFGRIPTGETAHERPIIGVPSLTRGASLRLQVVRDEVTTLPRAALEAPGCASWQCSGGGRPETCRCLRQDCDIARIQLLWQVAELRHIVRGRAVLRHGRIHDYP